MEALQRYKEVWSQRTYWKDKPLPNTPKLIYSHMSIGSLTYPIPNLKRSMNKGPTIVLPEGEGLFSRASTNCFGIWMVREKMV